MEHIFPPKTATLVANTQTTIVWSATDIGPRFSESIIKRAVSIRFSCVTTSLSSVNCGVRYSTLTKDYLVAERRTLFFIPPSSSAEITPASKPALGLLNTDIVSFSLDMISASSGTVTVILIVDDEPPPLTSEAGELIGLDAKFALDYLLIQQGGATVVLPPGGTSMWSYTVPAGKRAIIRSLYANIPITPSFPGILTWTFTLTVAGFAASYSSTVETLVTVLINDFLYTLPAGETISASFFNADTTNYAAASALLAEEIF